MIKLMKFKYLGLGSAALVMGALATWAAVSVSAQPLSLVTNDLKVKAQSASVGMVRFGLGADSGETLSSVSITINNNGTSVATGADLASVALYRDDGDNILEAGSDDLLVGSQTAVNVASATSVTASANNTLPGTFFVTLATSASWSDANPADSVTVSLAADGIVTSANSPTVTAVSTSTITADTTGPVLIAVVAQNTAGVDGKNAGDSLEFTFGEATTKSFLTATQLAATFTLNNSHSLLDGLGLITSESWNSAGTVLTVVISGNVTLPSVNVGDTVTMAGAVIKDAANNTATGTVTITGNFSTVDITAPHLTSATAHNTGNNQGAGAGDTVVLAFDEATNKPAITKDNINAVLTLNNSHSWLDGSGNIGSTSWNTGGTMLTVTLSAGTSAPTIVVGDTVTVAGSIINDAANNHATGNRVIGGNFGNKNHNDDNEDEDDDEGEHGACDNGLLNGRIYSVSNNDNFYLAAACRLKVFNGAAIGKALGQKFLNIINLDNLGGLTVSNSTHNRPPADDDEEEIELKSKGKFKIKLFGNHGNKGKGHNDD